MYDFPGSLALMPEEGRPEYEHLLDLSFSLATEAAELGGLMPEMPRRAIARLVRAMNCFYSNLIEGHNTHPRDIQRAMEDDYSADPAVRDKQVEARAHIKIQELIDAGHYKNLGLGMALVRAIHRDFYEHMPASFQTVSLDGVTHRVVPGEWRNMHVVVGRHEAIAPDMVPAFMEHFETGYSRVGHAYSLIAAAASHHRLAWIHPFLDGNGRTARLYTHAWFRRSTRGSDLWSVSRGLARTLDQYRSKLARADYPPQGANDGRGTLSTSGLAGFCAYFLETALDQVRFMREMLDPKNLLPRLKVFVQQEVEAGRLDARSFAILQMAWLQGHVSKSEMETILGVSDRHARRIVMPLANRGLLESESKASPYTIGFPIEDAEMIFPRLFQMPQTLGAVAATGAADQHSTNRGDALPEP